MSIISIVIIEEGKTPVLARASTFPGAPPGTTAGLVTEVAEILKAHEDGESELWFSEKDGINTIDIPR